MTEQRYKVLVKLGAIISLSFGMASGAYANTTIDKATPGKSLALDTSIVNLNNEDTEGTLDIAPVNDPYEKFNRAMFGFNEVVDKVALKPVATLYSKVTPKPIAKGIGNFFANIDTVPTVLNDILQGNFYQATSDTWRLLLNSTVGILGFFDVAASLGLEPNTEDFGLTLARWGYTNSTYLVLPLIGASTFRDGIGWPVNYYFLTIYPYVEPSSLRYELYGLGVISKRADLLHFQGTMEQLSFDKYIFMRDAYTQRRNYQIQRNKELGNPYLDKEKNNEASGAIS